MDRALAAELHRRVEQDQASRRRALETNDGQDLVQIGADNTRWFKEVVARCGWPGNALVGEQRVDAA
ncbi:hypothetical protein [Streptomyces sp. NPDC056632]|uniref:hypothetical protein n=1 Tax=Streptomyces sp. NPDC056632 TaxID=3345884 RepID=UPI0036A4998F